jgi:hypothetical protein
MKTIVGLSVIVSLTFVACKNLEIDDSKNSSLERPNATPVTGQIINQPAVVFNWSRDGGSLENHLRTQAGDAHARNRTIGSLEELPSLGAQGFGLYTINDPLSSKGFGVDLSCLTIQSKWTITAEGELDNRTQKFGRIQSDADVLAYLWGTPPLTPEKYKTAWSAVIRNPRVVDLAKSSKFSMALNGMTQGLSPARLAAGRRALQEGNLCKALAVYENDYGSFIHSLIAAAVPLTGNEKIAAFPVEPFSFGREGALPLFKAGASALAADAALVKDLVAAGKIKLSDRPEIDEVFFFNLIQTSFNRIAGSGGTFFIRDPEVNAAEVELLRRIAVGTKIIQIDSQVLDAQSLQKAVYLGLVDKITQWKAAHGDEVAFMTELWQKLTAANLEAALTSIGI